MGAGPDLLLVVPVVVWLATGVGIVVAARRSQSVLYLRLAAAFFALWALLATTTLLYVLAHGGGPAVARLLLHPVELFAPNAVPWWIEGALGAVLVLGFGFLLNQLVGRAILSTLAPRPLAWPARLPRPSPATWLGRFPSDLPEAFSFTLLVRAPTGGTVVGRRELILVSDRLLERLDPAEQEAVIAHELGHLRALDSRYLTFLRTCARLLRWDPVVALLASSVTRAEELRADRVAVQLTGRPLALASALAKVADRPSAGTGVLALGLLGPAWRRRGDRTAERIRRLTEDSGTPSPGHR